MTGRQAPRRRPSNSHHVGPETFPDWGDVDDWCIDDVQVWDDRVYMSIEHRRTNYRWVVPLGEFVKE